MPELDMPTTMAEAKKEIRRLRGVIDDKTSETTGLMLKVSDLEAEAERGRAYVAHLHSELEGHQTHQCAHDEQRRRIEQLDNQVRGAVDSMADLTRQRDEAQLEAEQQGDFAAELERELKATRDQFAAQERQLIQQRQALRSAADVTDRHARILGASRVDRQRLKQQRDEARTVAIELRNPRDELEQELDRLREIELPQATAHWRNRGDDLSQQLAGVRELYDADRAEWATAHDTLTAQIESLKGQLERAELRAESFRDITRGLTQMLRGDLKRLFSEHLGQLGQRRIISTVEELEALEPGSIIKRNRKVFVRSRHAHYPWIDCGSAYAETYSSGYLASTAMSTSQNSAALLSGGRFEIEVLHEAG